MLFITNIAMCFFLEKYAVCCVKCVANFACRMQCLETVVYILLGEVCVVSVPSAVSLLH